MRGGVRKEADYILILYFAILLLGGLIILTSASTAVGYDRFQDSYFFIKRQLLFGLLPGLLAFFLAARIPYLFWKKYSVVLLVATVVLLLAVFLPGIGSTLNTSAKSWLVIAGVSFQPAEIAKLGLIIFLAAYLSDKGKELQDFKKGFLVALGLGLIPIALVVLQPDVGTAAILFMILFGMLFVADAHLWHLLALAGAGLGGLALMVLKAPYRAARLMTFMHPELDPLGVGYHVNQALLAIGSGGLFGVGLGHSRQKFQYLPEVHADSIYAVFAEEMGFLFAAGFIVLLLLICYRSLMLAKHAPDEFSRLLIAGIIIWFVVQSFLNIGAMVNLLPLTGVPLPFVSHGGSALMVAMGAVGILVNISKHRT